MMFSQRIAFHKIFFRLVFCLWRSSREKDERENGA